MLLRYFYGKSLAHASRRVGCQRTGEVIVIDPSRSMDQYLAAATAEVSDSSSNRRLKWATNFENGRKPLVNKLSY
ncbi:MAG: hypothetical protein SFV81_18545 [Pirellulaceae bacterium]|nr:hypothetical protein [Pirellulaceae bacterium]